MDEPDSGIVLYDTGRASLWFHVPMLLLRVALLLVLTILIIKTSWTLQWPDLFLAFCWFVPLTYLALGTVYWHLRKRILWDSAGRSLVVEDRLLFLTTRQRIPASKVDSIEVRHGLILKSTVLTVRVRGLTGRTTWLAQVYKKENAVALAKRIADAVGCQCLS